MNTFCKLICNIYKLAQAYSQMPIFPVTKYFKINSKITGKISGVGSIMKSSLLCGPGWYFIMLKERKSRQNSGISGTW